MITATTNMMYYQWWDNFNWSLYHRLLEIRMEKEFRR